jgi:hypothetical protein
VKSSIAKDQRLSTLNPAQISGSCGRLMCCLRYEHEFYVQQRKRFPKEGKILVTALGEEKVVSNDIFREQVTLRTATGEMRTLALGALKKEIGGELLSSTAEHQIEPDDDEGEEEVMLFVEIERAPPREPAPAAAIGVAEPEADASEVATTAEGEARKRRRRRGRRGGRRGRDGGDPTGSPPGGDTPANTPGGV